MLCVAAAYAVMAQGPGWNQNSHYALIRAMSDGTPTIDRTRYETGAWYFTGDISDYRGHVYSNKAPGFAFATFPAYQVMKAAGKAKPVQYPTGQLWFLSLWSVVLPACILLLLVRKIGDELEPGFGTAAAVTLGLATLILPFSTLFFSHLFSAMLGFAAFAILWYERQGPPRLAWVGAAGLLAGYAITTEFPNAITAGVVGCYALARSGALRRGLAYGGGAILGLVPLLLYNQWAFGSPAHLSYQSTVGFGPTGTLFLTTPSFRRAVEVLFAPVGLLRMTPIVVLGAVGTVLLYRRGQRLEALLIGGIALAYLIFESSYKFPFGGSSPGPRQLIPILPFLALPLATAYRRLPVTTLALAIPSAVVMVAVTVTHPVEYWEGYARWFHQVGEGNFSATILSLFGGVSLDQLKLPSSTHWYSLLLFLVPVVLAVALPAAQRPRIRLSWHDVLSGATCFLGWLVIQREAPRWLAGNGVSRHWAPLAVTLLAIAVAAVALALPYVFRRSPRAPRRRGVLKSLNPGADHVTRTWRTIRPPPSGLHVNETPETRADPTPGLRGKADAPQRSPAGRQGRVRVGAVAAVAIAVGFIIWAAVGTGGGGGGSSVPPTRNVKGTNPVALSLSGLETLSGAFKQPIYWVGKKPGAKYELRQTNDAKVYVRYLPPGVPAGDPRPLLTVGTYSMQNAFSATQAIAKTGVQVSAGHGAVAVQPKGDSARVYVAFSGNDYQIEVYSPTPGQARRLVERGAVKAVQVAKPITPRVRAITPAGLKRLAAGLGQPIYWVGPEPNVTYELTQTKGGLIYVRYLPAGVNLGDRSAFLTIGTYPVTKAFDVTKALAKRPHNKLIGLNGGGIAVFSKTRTARDVYVAFPNADYQIEVFDPKPGNARKLVTSQQVVAVG